MWVWVCGCVRVGVYFLLDYKLGFNLSIQQGKIARSVRATILFKMSVYSTCTYVHNYVHVLCGPGSYDFCNGLLPKSKMFPMSLTYGCVCVVYQHSFKPV